MSSIGFPDGQRITQWLGASLVSQSAAAIGNVLHTDGPFNLASWASVVVAIKPTGGNVTVTVRQQINGGPPGLTLPTSFVVPDGQTLFESVVLFGDAVYIDLTGSAPGVVVDYAVYPSNTTTNAQVLATATINVQHNEALIASEGTLDFVDANGVVWVTTDDPANTRMKVQAKLPAFADTTLAAASSLIDVQNIPATAAHLRMIGMGRGDAAALSVSALLRLNADAGNNYEFAVLDAVTPGGAASGAAGAQPNGKVGDLAAATAPAGEVGTFDALLPAYRESSLRKTIQALNVAFFIGGAGGDELAIWASRWTQVAAVNRVQMFPSSGNLVIGSHFTIEPVFGT